MNYADEVASYIHDVKYGTWEQMVNAARKIRELNDPEIINTLISDMLATKNEYVSERLSGILEGSESKLVVPLLLDRLHSAQTTDGIEKLGYCLGSISDPRVVQPLIDLANHPEWAVRLMVARMLGTIGDKKAGPILLQMLDDVNYLVRNSAILSLGYVGYKAAIPKLMTMFDSLKLPPPSVILRALELINAAHVTEPLEAEKLLVQALDDKDPEVRAGATAILTQRPLIGIIIFRTADDDDAAYFNGAQSLIEVQDTRLIILAAFEELATDQAPDSPVIQLFIKALKDQYPRVRAKATSILAMLEIPGILPLLLEEIDHPDKNIADAAAKELLYASDPQTPETLEKFADRNNTLRFLLGRAWVQVWGEKGLEYLIKALGTDDPDIFRETVRALAEYGDARAVTPLLEAFGREENRRNEAALEQVIKVFDKYGDATTVPFLLEVQETGPQHLREMAQTALGHIRERHG